MVRRPRSSRRSGLEAALGLLAAAAPAQALAANCSASGGLVFIGKTANDESSVWLSATSAGVFRLEAASGSAFVDAWSKSRRGLRISVSPLVSQGNGGTHKLFDDSDDKKPCLLDTQNQKGGFTLPPNVTRPPWWPGGGGGGRPPFAPPTGVMPTLPPQAPGGGVTPPIGTVPPTGVMPTLPPQAPGGVTPPIGTLPPTGVMPTLPPQAPGGVTPPIGTLPPTGVMPTLPPRAPGGVTPPIGTLPPTGVMPTLPPRAPGGVTPPIGALPPTGVMPTLPPGGVTPPIGTLPPTGVMPTLPPQAPGGVTPPIGTLPPTGVMPTLPPRGPGGVTPPIGTVPPTGVMPTLPPRAPGGVTPPIGTLPPTGVMPTLPPQAPGGVTPPIGTLPPTGVMPTLPPRGPGGVTPPIGTVPPTGVMPTLPPRAPGGVTPPIGTVPPTGVMPTLPPRAPGGVTPPIGTLPPTGVMPGLPSRPGVQPPASVIPPEVSQPPTALAELTRAQPAADCPPAAADRRQLDEATRARCPEAGLVPLTPGRDLPKSSAWNTWVQIMATATSDERSGLDSEASAGSLSVGVDRRLNADWIVGLTASWLSSKNDSFGGELSFESSAWSVGPYFAGRLSDRWAMDGSVTYGETANDTRLFVLSGAYTTRQLSAQAGLHAQYVVASATVRPTVSVSYSRLENEAHDLRGVVFSRALAVTLPKDTSDFGLLSLSTEVSKVVAGPGGAPLIPYLDGELDYEFVRPNDGQYLTGDLKFNEASPWSFALRGGMRMLLTPAVALDASAGYLSFGQPGLEEWEGRVQLSVAF